MAFSIATWNVNSLRVRLPQVLSWLQEHEPDVLALQETKLTDENFPFAEIEASGYQVQFSGQPTYNGVAILSKKPLLESIAGIDGFLDPQKRILSATVSGIRIVNLYVPNGQRVGSEKYEYKLAWLKQVTQFLADELKRYPKMIVLGDFNIAPTDLDVHDPSACIDEVLVSEPERLAFQAMLNLGFVDSLRMLYPEEIHFTWWDYRVNAFKRNRGYRIDHILLSQPLAKTCISTIIDKIARSVERPSDHAPVMINLA